jgi:hypothetical protein
MVWSIRFTRDYDLVVYPDPEASEPLREQQKLIIHTDRIEKASPRREGLLHLRIYP